jgi:transcriptional regulator with XRE-family HTH domain
MSEHKKEVRELNLGQKIRNLRQERRLTLQELSDASTLSKPLLSQIENDQVIPPIATLLKIAKGLKIGIHYFFEEEGDRQKYVLSKADDGGMTPRRSGNDSPHGYLYRSLAPGIRHKQIEPFLVEFELRQWSDDYFYRHEGVEFIYLLEGELEFHFGTETLVMSPGDSVYYDSNEPHGFIARGTQKARAVAVLYSKD